MALTKFEQKTLEILRDRGILNYTSAVGYILLEATQGVDRKPNPSPQGVALFAGRFLGPLQRRGLVNGFHGWSITAKGLAELAEHEKPTGQGDFLQEQKGGV